MRGSLIYTDEEISQHIIDEIIKIIVSNKVSEITISDKSYRLLKRTNPTILEILQSSIKTYVNCDNKNYTIETIPKEDKMEIKVNNLTDEQLKEVSALVKKFEEENEKPKSVIDYNNGFIMSNGIVYPCHMFQTSQIDHIYSLGLYRNTKEECEVLFRKMQIEHRLREWSKLCKDKVDWSNCSQRKYYIRHSNFNKSIDIDSQGKLNYDCIYFTDESILQKAVEDIGKQNLIDNYFVEV